MFLVFLSPGIFASVLTSVLVLMFYLVGESAFRLILLIITFVFVLTLLLACFIRQPSLMLLGNSPFLVSIPPLFNRPNAPFTVPVIEMYNNRIGNTTNPTGGTNLTKHAKHFSLNKNVGKYWFSSFAMCFFVNKSDCNWFHFGGNKNSLYRQSKLEIIFAYTFDTSINGCEIYVWFQKSRFPSKKNDESMSWLFFSLMEIQCCLRDEFHFWPVYWILTFTCHSSFDQHVDSIDSLCSCLLSCRV